MGWLLIAVFFLGVLVSYGAGVKKGAAWGTPVLILCVIGLIGVVGQRVFVGPGAGGPGDVGAKGVLKAASEAEWLGRALKGRIPEGSRIFILSFYDPARGRDMTASKEAWTEGLSDGLGDTTWEVVGYYGPTPGTAGDLSYGFDGMNGLIDAVVSVSGLPPDLEQMNFYQFDPVPEVAAFFRSAETDLELIRSWLEGGYLAAAVVSSTEGEVTTYTPENLP